VAKRILVERILGMKKKGLVNGCNIPRSYSHPPAISKALSMEQELAPQRIPQSLPQHIPLSELVER
jgi:hypothetical protein